jgi:putative FmdB family regulatory protein
MPTYDYECQKCGYLFEAFHGISDKPLAECPKCKGVLKKLISAGSGLIFKGSGFYITDYKKKNSVPSTPAPKKEGAKENPAPPAKSSKDNPAPGSAKAKNQE